MYKICIMESSAQRQRELEQGFLSVLKLQDFEDLSINDLCKQLGITRKCFYRYFSGKEGALNALLDHTLLDLSASLHPSTAEASSSEVLESFFRFWQEQKILLDVLERNGLSMLLYQRTLHLATHEPDFSFGLLTDKNNDLQKQRILFVVCGMMTMIISWHHKKYQPPLKQIVETARKLLTQPLFPQ